MNFEIYNCPQCGAHAVVQDDLHYDTYICQLCSEEFSEAELRGLDREEL